MKTRTALALTLATLGLAACGSDDSSSSTTKGTDAPAIERDRNGQAIVRVTDEATAAQQCEAIQGAWPEDVPEDVVYFFQGRENLLSCGRP